MARVEPILANHYHAWVLSKRKNHTVGVSATPLVKRGLVTIGAILPERAIYDLNGVINYLAVGAFVRRRGFPSFRRVATKHEVWEVIARELGD